MIFDRPTLGGEYIRCKECNQIDEYLPGLHEPKGYSGIDYNSIGARVKNPSFKKGSNNALAQMPRPKANVPPSHYN